MEKIFITGANGFIGSNLCRYFLGKGFDVYGFVRKTSDLHFLDGLNVHLIPGDLREAEKMLLPHDLDYIVHAASLVSDTAGDKECHQGIYRLTENFVRNLPPLAQLKKFVYISTALTLGFNSLNISEENPGRSAEFLPYTRYKKKTEEYVLGEYKKNGLPVVILRPTDVYGPNDRVSCTPILKGCDDGFPIIVGHGKWLISFCYINNLCQAVYLACRTKGIEGRAYTVANGDLVTWKELFGGFQKGLKRKQRVYVPVSLAFTAAWFLKGVKKILPSFEPPINFYRIKRITSSSTYDISRTMADLGYQPDNQTEKQIEAIVSWYLQEKEQGFIKKGRK